MTNPKPTIGIIGAGKVGATFAHLLCQAGYQIQAIYNRHVERAQHVAEQVGALVVDSPDEVVERSDLTLLTVTDDAISLLATSLQPADMHGKGIVHSSGARGAESLASLAEYGAMIGSLHPAFPFADVNQAVAGLSGATFAIEAQDQRLEAWLQGLVQAFGGSAVVIPPGGKATYHLALALISAYVVTLYSISEQLLLSLGTEKQVANQALNTLVSGTVENLHQQRIPAALVGPLTRTDVGTIAAHLNVLHKLDPQFVQMYTALARLSYPMLEARGIPIAPIEQLLKQEEQHESFNS